MKTIIYLLFIVSIPLSSINIPDKVFLEDKMNFYNVPGLSISVIKNNEPSIKNFGNVKEDELFQVSSFSKPLTALAVFKLVDSGFLDLDRDINSYLNSWKIKEDPVTRNRKVTLRFLLSHTAGIEESGPKGYLENVPTFDDILKKIHIRYYPGLIRRYSWSGYTIIQKIIEDVTKEEFATYMEREILIPLGMQNSSFRIPSKRVVGYDLFGNEIDGGYRIYPELAASGLWSNTEDISKFIIEINRIKTQDYEGLVTKKSIDEMLTYQAGGWGAGLSLKYEDDKLIFRHSGKNAGFTHYFISKVYSGEAIVIMTNGDNGWKLIMEIIHLFNKEDWGI